MLYKTCAFGCLVPYMYLFVTDVLTGALKLVAEAASHFEEMMKRDVRHLTASVSSISNQNVHFTCICMFSPAS